MEYIAHVCTNNIYNIHAVYIPDTRMSLFQLILTLRVAPPSFLVRYWSIILAHILALILTYQICILSVVRLTDTDKSGLPILALSAAADTDMPTQVISPSPLCANLIMWQQISQIRHKAAFSGRIKSFFSRKDNPLSCTIVIRCMRMEYAVCNICESCKYNWLKVGS